MRGFSRGEFTMYSRFVLLGGHFVDRHRTQLVQSVSDTPFVLKKLEDEG